MDMPDVQDQNIQPYLQRLLGMPFIEDVQFSREKAVRDRGIDGFLKVQTPKEKQIFIVEVKRSYLDTALLHSLIAQSHFLKTQHKKDLLVFARYVPTPSAQKLITAGINFIDDAGNMHIKVGSNYERTVVGLREGAKTKQSAGLTAALVQLLFTFASDPSSVNWTVRQLEEASEVSKSNVANIRRQLAERGVLRNTRRGFEILDRQSLQDQLLLGYEHALRPKLLLGRFRSAVDTENIVPTLRAGFEDLGMRWSLTGSPAAFALQRYYRGTETPVFVEHPTDAISKLLRLIPDKAGPLIVFNSFGTLPFWKKVQDVTIAHPWLIYAELMSTHEPRAHEAAQELKNEYLNTPNV
jgi:hypothetical protein